MLFVILMAVLCCAGNVTWSNFTPKTSDSQTMVLLNQFALFRSSVRFDSGPYISSNVIRFSNSRYRLVRSKHDTLGLTLLIKQGKVETSILDYFFDLPEEWFVTAGKLGFAWRFPGEECIYKAVAICDSVKCPYRPSEMLTEKYTRHTRTRFAREHGYNFAWVVRKIRSDSIEQADKNMDIRGFFPGQYDFRPESVYLKPMIYLYPDSAMPVDIRIGPVSSLAMTYPKDDSGKWQVQAYPDGRLVERKTGKEFYGLYWEGKNWTPPPSDTGVVVRGSELAQALDSLLELKGLNFRERQECVTFWMHSLVNSPWVMIQFFDQEFAKAHPLTVSPAPTTMLRVALSFRKLTTYVPLHPPVLTKPQRRGFTVVEWGGQVRDDNAEKTKYALENFTAFKVGALVNLSVAK